MRAVGLDGFCNGWVAVSVDRLERRVDFLTSLHQLDDLQPDIAMIDMPIGLPETGNRVCDIEAKKLLRAGSPRVFTGARRNYWDFPAWELAHHYYKAKGDKGVSRQLWCLGSKIKEVDEYITPMRQSTLMETHPELVFWRLNGKQVLPSKKSRDGKSARREIVRNHGYTNIDDWLDHARLGTGAKVDDVLDACACAFAAAERSPERRLPHEPPIDSKGLRMEMWF